MTKIQLARLEQLGNHILNGKLAHRVFDFSTINEHLANGRTIPLEDNKCGTHGCAFGELPTLWPEQFAWANNGLYLVKTDNSVTILCTSRTWFGLDETEASILFFPDGGVALGPETDKFAVVSGCRVLQANATREEVGRNILRMVEWKREQQ